ncbi:hypothetical protein RhiirB3_440673 [Rhizophagus irregularis]|nr:hypothetical protein RhiirB3_440673 [Rhizophagus irregularis]
MEIIDFGWLLSSDRKRTKIRELLTVLSRFQLKIFQMDFNRKQAKNYFKQTSDRKRIKIYFGWIFKDRKKRFVLVTYLISKRSPFRAIQCFDPRFIQSNIVCHNILDYGIIEVLHSPTDNLIQEWAIYCGLNELVEKLIDLDVYWRNKIHLLPELSALILVYI